MNDPARREPLESTIHAPKPSVGSKAIVARMPGVLVVHRLFKNLRYWSKLQRGTVGGVKRSRMSVGEAADYTESIFHKIDGFVGEDTGWDGKRVLEVGPGDSLATGLWCIGAGAESFLAIDRFAVEFDAEFERQVFGEVAQRLADGQPVPNAGRADREFKVGYRNDLPIEAAPVALGRSGYDVIFSNAVLEHVADLPGTLEAMWELLAPGGVMLHDVDLRSHQTHETHPLQFLEYPDSLWSLMSSHNGEPNRVRLPAYLKCLAELGFIEVSYGVTQTFERALVERVRPRLAKDFRKMDPADLLPAVFWLKCRKPW